MKRKRTIFIELTSLLDVILIMIFVLLIEARSQTAQAMDRAAREEQTAQEIGRELEEARESMSAAEAEAAVREETLREEIRGLHEEAPQDGPVMGFQQFMDLFSVPFEQCLKDLAVHVLGMIEAFLLMQDPIVFYKDLAHKWIIKIDHFEDLVFLYDDILNPLE